MNEQVRQVQKISKFLKGKIGKLVPETAIILGSGLSHAIPKLSNPIKVAYTSVPGFLKSTVPGHVGQFIFGKYKGKNIVVMQGRFHLYEGYEAKRVAVPIRVLAALGVRKIIVTAASGSLTKALKPGSLLVLKDHINFSGQNPLVGNYHSKFGDLFPDMTNAYKLSLRKKALKIAKKAKLFAKEGVYVMALGPSYETPAEIKAYRILGADAVGMSVVPEVVSACQLGMEILGVSVVSNYASGILKQPLNHEEVLEETKKILPKLKVFFSDLISKV
jgi:purine-nucleoside phosphorylase